MFMVFNTVAAEPEVLKMRPWKIEAGYRKNLKESGAAQSVLIAPKMRTFSKESKIARSHLTRVVDIT